MNIFTNIKHIQINFPCCSSLRPFLFVFLNLSSSPLLFPCCGFFSRTSSSSSAFLSSFYLRPFCLSSHCFLLFIPSLVYQHCSLHFSLPSYSSSSPFPPTGDLLQTCLFGATTHLGPCCRSHQVIGAEARTSTENTGQGGRKYVCVCVCSSVGARRAERRERKQREGAKKRQKRSKSRDTH